MDNPSAHFDQPPTHCKQYTNQDEDDEKELTEAARNAERKWRAKHPQYTGQPLRLQELTRQSIHTDRTTLLFVCEGIEKKMKERKKG